MLQVGDDVAICGLNRINNNGQCAYTDDQMTVDGLLLKHGTDKVWTGTISRMDGEYALVAGGWRHISCYRKVV